MERPANSLIHPHRSSSRQLGPPTLLLRFRFCCPVYSAPRGERCPVVAHRLPRGLDANEAHTSCVHTAYYVENLIEATLNKYFAKSNRLNKKLLVFIWNRMLLLTLSP